MKTTRETIQEIKDLIWLKDEIHRLEKINKSRGHCTRTFCKLQDLKVALKNSL